MTCNQCGYLAAVSLIDAKGAPVPLHERQPVRTLPMFASKAKARAAARDWAADTWPGDGLRFKAAEPIYHPCLDCREGSAS